MDSTQSARASATDPSARGWCLTVIGIGLGVIAAILLLPGVELARHHELTLLAVGVPLFVLSLALSRPLLESSGFRCALGLLYVMIYLDARIAWLPEKWVPKNEWDEAWAIPWVTVLLCVLLPVWIAHWVSARRAVGDVAAQRSWTVAAVLIVATALAAFAVLSRAYPDAIEFGYTMGVSLQVMEAALVFAMSAAERSRLALRTLTIVAFAAALAKATVL